MFPLEAASPVAPSSNNDLNESAVQEDPSDAPVVVVDFNPTFPTKVNDPFVDDFFGQESVNASDWPDNSDPFSDSFFSDKVSDHPVKKDESSSESSSINEEDYKDCDSSPPSNPKQRTGVLVSTYPESDTDSDTDSDSDSDSSSTVDDFWVSHRATPDQDLTSRRPISRCYSVSSSSDSSETFYSFESDADARSVVSFTRSFEISSSSDVSSSDSDHAAMFRRKKTRGGSAAVEEVVYNIEIPREDPRMTVGSAYATAPRRPKQRQQKSDQSVAAAAATSDSKQKSPLKKLMRSLFRSNSDADQRRGGGGGGESVDAMPDAVAEFAYDHQSRINHNPLYR